MITWENGPTEASCRNSPLSTHSERTHRNLIWLFVHVGVIHPLVPHVPQNGRCAQYTCAGSGGFRSDRV